MKTISHLIAIALLTRGAYAAALLEERFSYTSGNLGSAGVGSTVWTGGDSANSSITVNSVAALSFPNLVGATGSGVIFTGGTFKKKAAPFTAVSGDGNSVYCSFLLNIQSAPSTIKPFVYLQSGNSASSSPPLGIFLDSSSRVGLGKSVSSPGITLASGLSAGTHLVVVRYRFLAGNDQVDLWMDPASLGNDATIPAADLVTGGSSSSDASSLSYVFLNHAVSQTLWLDEVRVGATWSDVTPTNGSVVPPVTAPYVTQTLVSGGTLILRGTNGPASTIYSVLASTNLSLPAAQWPAIATNNFDANGNFDCTNPISAGVSRRFYRLLVGTQSYTPPTAPTISNQPQNLTIGVGQNATFSVTAGGTSPLSYRWHFNTNTPLPNATSASFTLTNVSTNNAGGYSVIVSNIAGSVTSMVATLTVTNLPPSVPAITTQPQNQTVTEGQTANFNVVATGTAPLNYQWYFNTNTPLTDKTNATLTLNTVSTNDAGAYSVIVTNSLGSVTSAAATLTVNVAPTNGGPLQILQAEDATFTGSVATDHAGYTGSGFVDTANATGSYIEWEFGRQHAGTEAFHVRYAHGKSDNRTASVTVNGAVVINSLSFPPTGSFTTWQYVTNTIPVVAGRNVLRLTALTSEGLANLDRIEISGDPQFKLSVTANGRGGVSLAPTNAFGFFNPGTVVTLTAVPQTGAVFVAWSGALTGTNNPESLTMDDNKSVAAEFYSVYPSTLYVSPTGNDSNPGTIDQPLYSLSVAVAAVVPGDIIYMRGGAYSYAATVLINKTATSNSPISLVAYPGEKPVLDYSAWTPANEDERGGARGIKVATNAAWWLIKGLEIAHAPDNGVKCEGSHITFEQCVFHHNGDTGLQIGLNKDTFSTNPNPDNWAAYVLVLNCDAYRNADPATGYENADGIDVKLYAGKGNRLVGCRSWENCDDGYDCYQTEYEITFDNCWAWHNGDPALFGFSSFAGDGNCFKLGGDNTFCPMTLKNCVASDAQWGTTVGFAFNNNTAPITLYNCSALNCGRPYKFEQNGNAFKNCLDWSSTRPAPVDITGTSTQVNNSWNLSVTVTAADFLSVSAADAIALRQADGSLPANGFARLADGSDLIDAGVDVGIPFNGSAPDLGAYEFQP